jgi:dolichol-phosphate mannosyltransferase
MTRQQKTRISVVIPAYNEEANIPMLRQRLTALFSKSPTYDWEVVIVDDHSGDATPDLIKAWARADPRVRLVRFSRNFGSYVGWNAGLAECTGDAAVLMAADLQDPPELMLEMARKWEEGSDLVWAVRAGREGEKASIKLFSRLFYAVMRKASLPEIPPTGADFLLIDRKAIDAYLKIPEKNTHAVCLLMWMGFRQSFVPYVKQVRASGQTKWTFPQKVKLFMDGLVSFSFAPLRAMSVVGLLFAMFGFGFAVVVVVGKLAHWYNPPLGYAALMTVLLVGTGLIMLMLGVIGEYLWRTFDEARGRPRYIIEERFSSPRTGQGSESSNQTYVAVHPEEAATADGPEKTKPSTESDRLV